MPKRALLSVYNKDGIEAIGHVLSKHGYEILSTGGTARTLRTAGIEVKEVSEVTQSQEYPGGLVKTLHPKIYFAILADRGNQDHLLRMEREEIIPIDIVICNLYAFCDVANKENVTEEDLRDLIDIGGPTMVRASAKNWKYVVSIVDPSDYVRLEEELDNKAYLEEKIIELSILLLKIFQK